MLNYVKIALFDFDRTLSRGYISINFLVWLKNKKIYPIDLYQEQIRLMKMYEKLLRWSLNIGKVVVFAKNNSWNMILGSGISGDKYIHIDVEKDLNILLKKLD